MRLIITGFLVFSLSSCGFFKESIGDYAQNVYMYHNNVLSKLIKMNTSVDKNSFQAEKLWNLEQSLNFQCRYLNEMSRRKAFNDEIPNGLEYNVSATVYKCQKKVIEINQELQMF